MTASTTLFEERAAAKINLTLDILGKRPDGYHELRSLVAFARDAADYVTLDTARPVGSSVTGPFGATLAGQNLIDVTLAKLSAADSGLTLGHVTLTKNLPVAAGIGGGSADAAAVLRAAYRANADLLDRVDWQALALSLGADVPVCLHSGLAWMAGIGENITPVDRTAFNDPYVIIANPLVSVPVDKTARVFRALKAAPYAQAAKGQFPPYGRGAPDLLAITVAGTNALQAAAIEIMPIVADVMADLAALPGARLARMSGGGPTCFAMFETADAAAVACAMLRAARPAWWVVATALD